MSAIHNSFTKECPQCDKKHHVMANKCDQCNYSFKDIKHRGSAPEYVIGTTSEIDHIAFLQKDIVPPTFSLMEPFKDPITGKTVYAAQSPNHLGGKIFIADSIRKLITLIFYVADKSSAKMPKQFAEVGCRFIK